MPKFSIIIPTYNRKKLLKERALKSLSNQTFKDFEVIVINDGGEDVSDVIEEYKNKGLNIKYISYRENRKTSYARNRGIEMAQSEWIAFLDDDDEYLPDTLEIYNKHIKKNLNYLIFAPLKRLNKKDIRILKFKNEIDENTIIKLIIKWYLTPGNYLIKKKKILEIGGFDEKIIIGEDIEFGLRLLFNSNFREEGKFVKNYTYVHYLNLFSQREENIKIGFVDSLYIIEKHKKELEMRNLLAYLYYRVGVFSLLLGKKREALTYFIKSFHKLPLHSSFRLFFLLLPTNIIRKINTYFDYFKILFLK